MPVFWLIYHFKIHYPTLKLKALIMNVAVIVTGSVGYTQQPDSVHSGSSLTKSSLPANLFGSALKNVSEKNPLKKLQGALDIRSAIHIDSFYVQYESQKNNATDSINFTHTSMQFQLAKAQFNAMLFRIPFTARYQYQQITGWAFPGSISVPVIEFNRELFVRSMSDRIRSSFDANSLVGERLAAIQNLKDLAMKELKEEMLKAVNGYSKDIVNKVKQLGDWKELMNGDISYFTKKLLGEKELAQLKTNELLIARTQEKMNNGEAVDAGVYSEAVKQVEKVKGLQKVVLIIMKYRKKWDESGLVKMIKKMETEKDLQLKEILSNPSVLAQLAKEKLSLQKLEKLFLSIKQFQAGAGANNISPLTLDQSLRSSGFNLETTGQGNGSLFATMGKLEELVSVAERSMAQGSQLNNPSTNMAGVSFGNHSSGQQDQYSKVSLMAFATSSSGAGTNMFSPISGSVARNLVFTISKKINIGSKGSLLTEISKSSAQGQNDNKPGGSTANSFSTSNLFNTNDFFSNLGLSAEYSNEFPGIDLSHEFSFHYTGNGYSNQGNSYLLPGSKELYNSLHKSFFNRKLNVVVINRYKSYSLDNSGKRVDNFSNTVDIRWKFSKGNYLAIKYQPAYSASLLGNGIMQNEVTTNRLAVDLNIRNKIKKIQVQNFINLAYLSTKTVFAGFGDDLYKTLQLTTTHSVMKGSQQFFVNTNFNYAFKNGSLPYLNSSLLAEGGIVYSAGKWIKLTSALNYNAVQNWYSQMVIKQGIGGQIGKKLDLNFNIDVAKNFKVLQPYPVQSLRSDISVRYLIF